MKGNLQENKVMLHLDYSDSYNNTLQDEIQSVYFGNSIFSIFTACGYILNERELSKRSVVVVGKSSDNSRTAALTCVNMVLNEIEKETKVKILIFWSDGCASQFRSRFVFKLLSSYRPELLLEWNYNEAHQGRGPMDGTGGTIKNVVFRQVKSRKVVINSPTEFYEAANQFVLSIKYLYQPESSLLEEPHDIKNALVIPNTLQTHRLVREIEEGGKASISFFGLSSDIDPVYVKDYKINLKCGHIEKEFQSLAMMANTCLLCMKIYGSQKDQNEDWLKCTLSEADLGLLQ